MHERASLLKNTVRSGNSVLIQALTASGRDAVGARITLRTNGARQADEIRSGGYYISQGDFRLHFGMGAETKAMLSVRWPDGKAEDLGRVEVNHWITVRQGKGIVERRKLAAQ